MKIKDLILLLILFLQSIQSYGFDYNDSWEGVPKKYHDRYDEVSANIDQKWVLAFADSLDDFAEEKNIDVMHFYASEIRSHYYYYKEDSLNFFEHNTRACDWAKKTDFWDRYYCEMINQVTFYGIINCKYQAQSAAQRVLKEAKAGKSNLGMYYGYSALGIVYMEKHDYPHAIENLTKALECCNQLDIASPVAKAQLYWYISTCYMEYGDYENAITCAAQSVELDPESEESMVVLAKSYYFTGQYDKFNEVYPKIKNCTAYDAKTHGDFMSHVNVLKCLVEKNYSDALSLCSKVSSVKVRLALKIEVYKHLGDWEKAYACQDELVNFEDSLTQSMQSEEMSEMSSELNTVYKVSEMDKELMRRKYLLIICSVIILCVLISGVFVYLRYKAASEKNKALTSNIDTLIKYKNMALTLEKEKYDRMKAASSEEVVDTPAQQEVVLETDIIESSEKTGMTDIEEQKIARFIYEITSRKLFVDPNFNRDALIDELHIQKRSFTKVFEAYTNSTFKEFLTSLRLEYAAQLIKERPEYTIEAIAAECGITSYVTFHRNFTRHFGIAPSSYRTQQ